MGYFWPSLDSTLPHLTPSLCLGEQEYSSYDRIKVEGQATLFLRTNVATINMKNHTVQVSQLC